MGAVGNGVGCRIVWEISFYSCGFLVVADKKIPIPPPVPLQRGIKGEDGGCKLVLVKTGNSPEKNNPLNPPFLRGI